MDEDLRAALAAINDRLARIEARLDEIPVRIKPYDYEHEAEACTNGCSQTLTKTTKATSGKQLAGT